MRVYYNENNPFCVEWLKTLIMMGEISDGEIDSRSIEEVAASDLRGFTRCHFFAGIAGWDYALKLAQWKESREVWTGSCPCQPFSVAGQRKGFADERHLWPIFKKLIAQRQPECVFGEQVASATQWLGLVRGDLEALGYAVGAMPVEAASAGADHLRDRFWFVADRKGEQVGPAGQPRQRRDVVDNSRVRRGERRPEHEIRSRWHAFTGASSKIDLADQHQQGSQGRPVLPECASEWAAWPDGVADAAIKPKREPSDKIDALAASGQARSEFGGGSLGVGYTNKPIGRFGNEQSARQQPQHDQTERTDYEWVLGADGKARRVKPGVRLLAHGVSARVAKLRAFGNAIDPRPASTFVKAFLFAEGDL